MDVFRESFRHKDGTKAINQGSAKNDATNLISQRSNARRLGVDEETLRSHVHDHLAVLMNTIRLDATVNLDDAPDVAKSVLNFGFQDLSNLTRKELTGFEVARSIKQSLGDHEPRLVPESIRVKVDSLDGDGQHRVSVQVTADLIADPADIPVEFQADVDLGAGKVILNKSRF